MKIILDKSKCIGCGSCVVVCPKYFELTGGNAHLKAAETKNTNETLEILKPECVQEAVNICPVQAIKIE